MSFKEKTALVTGGSRGIGRQVAARLAAEGANVAVNYRESSDAAQALVEQIKSNNGRAIAIKADIGEPDQARTLIENTVDKFGSIDILVNNAGVTRDGLIVRLSRDDWLDVINTNLTGAFYCLQETAKRMIKQRSGTVVNVSSIVGMIGNAGQTNYTAAKAGLIGLTKSAARELAPRNIRVNAVAPGFIKTEMTEDLDEALKSKIAERIPLGRFGTDEEVAEVIVWLASDKASYVTGQVVVIDGGLAM